MQDVALVGLSSLANSLTSLDLSYCYGITEQGFKNLSSLTKLKTLAMRFVSGGPVLAQYAFLTLSNLETVYLLTRRPSI